MTPQALAVLETLAIHGPMNANRLGAWLEVPTEEIYPSLVQLTDAKLIHMASVRRRDFASNALSTSQGLVKREMEMNQ